MPKIAFISSNEWVPWGGSEVLWSAAAERLARHGVKVSVSVRGWENPAKQIENLKSVGCELFYRWPPTFAERLRYKIFRGPEYVPEHVKLLGKGAGLIVVSQGLNIDGIHWMEAVRAGGFKLATIAQAATEHAWPMDDLAERLITCYEGAEAAFFVSEGNLSLTRRQLAADLPKARVIRNPYNVRYDAAPAWPENSEKELHLAIVARTETGTKGHDLLFQVLSQPKWQSRKVRVSVVGNGLCIRGIPRLAHKLGLTNIVFTGHCDDIEEVWSKHHAMVLPSRHEGMPLAVVEAMLCGRACIVTDVGGNRELVRDGINGFMAKAPTVELLDEAMNRAWESRGRLKEMGEQAARDVREWVSADPVGDFVQELERLVGGG